MLVFTTQDQARPAAFDVPSAHTASNAHTLLCGCASPPSIDHCLMHWKVWAAICQPLQKKLWYSTPVPTFLSSVSLSHPPSLSCPMIKVCWRECWIQYGSCSDSHTSALADDTFRPHCRRSCAHKPLSCPAKHLLILIWPYYAVAYLVSTKYLSWVIWKAFSYKPGNVCNNILLFSCIMNMFNKDMLIG